MIDKGLYILILKLKENQRIKAGRLPETEFRAGIYLYVGRAKCGLKKRLNRHLRRNKKLFWHIDYFLQKATIDEVWIKADFFDECRTIDQLKKFFKDSVFPLKNFGASDCNCPSHLLHLPEVSNLEKLREKLAFERIVVHGNQV